MPAPKGHPNYDVEGLAGRPKIYTDEFIDKKADELLKWFKEDEMHIFFDDFCLYQDLDPELMSIWANQHDRFSQVLKTAKKWQESRLRNGVLTKGYNNGMATLVLTNHHGYLSSKTESKVTQKTTIEAVLSEISGTTEKLVSDE